MAAFDAIQYHKNLLVSDVFQIILMKSNVKNNRHSNVWPGQELNRIIISSKKV